MNNECIRFEKEQDEYAEIMEAYKLYSDEDEKKLVEKLAAMPEPPPTKVTFESVMAEIKRRGY